ncbi:DUF4433 domain-containing protein [bacterium]|nr:DUF4433 domain-containing protein [bacterium]
MIDDRIKELYYIVHIDTVQSIMKNGILCHASAESRSHDDLSDHEVQLRRAQVIIPNAGLLHQYVNLYFDAHNPMLSKIRNQNENICVLCINREILFEPNVVITDKNAACDFVRFYKSPDGLENLDLDKIFARFWLNRDNPFEEDDHKRIKCAEVLVPDRIPPGFIISAIVCNESVRSRSQQAGFQLDVRVEPGLFF